MSVSQSGKNLKLKAENGMIAALLFAKLSQLFMFQNLYHFGEFIKLVLINCLIKNQAQNKLSDFLIIA